MLVGRQKDRNMEKQQAGFKFGKYSLRPLKELANITYRGRRYTIVLVSTSTGEQSALASVSIYGQKGGDKSGVINQGDPGKVQEDWQPGR